MTNRSLSDTQGLSPRNLKCMRDLAVAWPDRRIVQGPLAQITCLEAGRKASVGDVPGGDEECEQTTRADYTP